MNVHTRWEDPVDDEPCIAWAREYFNDTAPYATGGVYVNFVPEGRPRSKPHTDRTTSGSSH
jgi:hypothetical protein